MSGREERERAVELYFTTSMSTKQVVEHLGVSDQAVPGAVAACRSTVCRRRSQASHTVGGAASRGGAVPVRHAAEAGGRRTWRRLFLVKLVFRFGGGDVLLDSGVLVL